MNQQNNSVKIIQTDVGKVFKQKPIVSYFKAGDPTSNFDWVSRLTDINIIHTKKITDQFIDVVLRNQSKIFLHITINGMGASPLEPNIASVKQTFTKLSELISKGFPFKKVLVIVDPIIPNQNGLKALRLLLKVFSEFNMLRLRYVRFGLLKFNRKEKKFEKFNRENPGAITTVNEYSLQNRNIDNRSSTKQILPFIQRDGNFMSEYYKLINEYKAIITVDQGEEALIGTRELIQFGINNVWTDKDGRSTYIVEYEKNNKWYPKVNIISPNPKSPRRCHNKCLLCPYRD